MKKSYNEKKHKPHQSYKICIQQISMKSLQEISLGSNKHELIRKSHEISYGPKSMKSQNEIM
jgi:hypothetical protein